MPQAVDITVKNGATTPVDKTFSLQVPAAGDNSVGKWLLREGVIASVFPFLTQSASKTPQGRNLKLKFRLPSSYTDSVTGLTNVSSAGEMNVTFSVPDNFPESLKADYVAYCTNLLSSTLIKSMIRDAVPAT